MSNNVASDPRLNPPQPGSKQNERDPEDRPAAAKRDSLRDKMLDKTLADSFPTSDPPSTLPDPCVEDSFEEEAA